MEIKSNFFKLPLFLAVSTAFCSFAYANNVVKNTAKLQALDKVTGRMSVIEAPVNGEVKFGSFSIVVRSCQTASPEETPEDYAFVDVADTTRSGKTFNIFKGWMLSSSPSLNSVEHPIYDVWLLKCVDRKNASSNQLSEQQLKTRDALLRLKEQDLSKEAKIAIEVQEEQARQEEIAKAEQQELDRKKEEAREEQARQKEIEQEMQYAQEPPAESFAPADGDGDGPVSLLNLGQQNAASERQKAQDNDATAKNLQGSDVSVPAVGGSVVIEDTHHEVIDQELDIPEDIEEVLPQ